MSQNLDADRVQRRVMIATFDMRSVGDLLVELADVASDAGENMDADRVAALGRSIARSAEEVSDLLQRLTSWAVKEPGVVPDNVVRPGADRWRKC